MKHGTMWEWEAWDAAAKTTLDLSYERNELGLIPLGCPGDISSSHRKCQTKVFDAPQKKITKGGTLYRKVQCLLCGHEDWRKVGLTKNGR